MSLNTRYLSCLVNPFQHQVQLLLELKLPRVFHLFQHNEHKIRRKFSPEKVSRKSQKISEDVTRNEKRQEKSKKIDEMTLITFSWLWVSDRIKLSYSRKYFQYRLKIKINLLLAWDTKVIQTKILENFSLSTNNKITLWRVMRRKKKSPEK